jgi:hypothetical protein
MEPTIENRQVTKRILEETPFTVTYFMNASPFELVALEKQWCREIRSSTELMHQHRQQARVCLQLRLNSEVMLFFTCFHLSLYLVLHYF